MSTERILQQVERLAYLIGQHAGLLTHLETELPPHHEDTIAALRQQFEAHIGFLLVNLLGIVHLAPAVHQQHHRTASCTLYRHGIPRAPPPTAIPAEVTPAPRRHPRIGNYPYYAVSVGRTTGIFTNWADCFQATNGITNDFRGFESLDGSQHYLTL
jgi:hypothetical protein